MVVPNLLDRLHANAGLISEVQDTLKLLVTEVDHLEIEQINRRRLQAAIQYAETRDQLAFNTALERLDHEEQRARRSRHAVIPARDVVAALSDMTKLFLTAMPSTRQRIVRALLEKVEVSGASEMWMFPSQEAIARGWAAAFAGEFRCSISQYGRGERSSADTLRVKVRITSERVLPAGRRSA